MGLNLKLRWARFFTLAEWQWRLSPRHSFDFQVTFPCAHSECSCQHALLVRISDKCYEALEEKHRATFGYAYNEPNPALFGDGPANTYWEMVHGAGGGAFDVSYFVSGANRLWEVSAHD